MKTGFYYFSVTILFLLCPLFLKSQSVDSTSFSIRQRLSFYSNEKEGGILLDVPLVYINKNLTINLFINNENSVTTNIIPETRFVIIPFQITQPIGNYSVEAFISTDISNIRKEFYASARFVKLQYRSNEVKIDMINGGLIVNGLPFFPFGFYCYSPVQPTLAEEEVVKGFNMMSPYQRILPATLKDRIKYMDRCAQLGMKVHYNLLSVAGGGGVGSSSGNYSNDEKRRMLINEIKTIMDHPALLGWYIADEPAGYGRKPEELIELYKIVKEYDPWHPVSIVFNSPYLSSKKYADAFDIVMADPYPVPDSQISILNRVTQQLKKEYAGRKSVWIVPQAFGGSEWWKREPTIQEIRSMTYQALVRGANGIQYFIRSGLNAFPKSTATWGECGRIAIEVAEMTPWLLSVEETIKVKSSNSNVLVSSYIHNGKLLILAVNTVNEPFPLAIEIEGKTTAKAHLLFENRTVKVDNSTINDYISSFGSLAYLIDLNTLPKQFNNSANLIIDPGFEDLSSPGIPSSCYVRAGKDKGATYFLDSRVHLEGTHSLRIITPSENSGVRLTFYPFKVNPGTTYKLSVWAKTDKAFRIPVKRSFWDRLFRRKKRENNNFELGLGSYGSAQFTPDSIWKEYSTFVTIPLDQDTLLRTNLTLQMPGQGVAWFDNLGVVEDVVISPVMNSIFDEDSIEY